MTPQEGRAVADAMAALWEGEMPATAQVLAAVKDDNRDYRPDPKSRTAWELATHIALADGWFIDSIRDGKFEWNQEAVKQAEAQFTSVTDIVDYYKRTIPEKLQSLRALPDERFGEAIDFFGMMQMPRARWIGFANNHSVHHRGQLAAYLRALGSKVPDIYGPSADHEPAAT